MYTMTITTTVCILLVLLQGHAWATPVSLHERERGGEPPRLGVVSELSQRLASHSAVEPRSGPEPRFPLPSPQELDALKKVAQILIMLGEQVIPAIIGEGDGGGGGGHGAHTAPTLAALGFDPPAPSPTAAEDAPDHRDPLTDN